MAVSVMIVVVVVVVCPRSQMLVHLVGLCLDLR